VIFTLEALKARHGDALLLHYGDAAKPRVALIDGGPSGTWPTVRGRLEELRAHAEQIGTLRDGRLGIDLAVVTHLDDDHVHGILDLSDDLVTRSDKSQDAPWKITGLWMNHFDDLSQGDSDHLLSATDTAELQSLAASAPTEGLRSSAAVLASIPQGRGLRDNARKLGWADNPGFEGLVMAPDKGGKKVQLDSATSANVVAPREPQLLALRKKWDEYMKKLRLKQKASAAELAAYVDRSVFNLSSIVALVEAGGKTMLLTGDGRGDQIMESLEAAGTMPAGGELSVDLLKLPHHGSDNDVAPDFFERIKASHYVVSGDGNYGNPESTTLRMLSDARKDDDFTLHLTYRDTGSLKGRLVQFFDDERAAGRTYKVAFREDPAASLKVDLLDAVDY
jgi:hypothetical protein